MLASDNQLLRISHRFSFGSENAFILLQPMYSFAIHDIGDDTPLTNWDNPSTVRDHIRCAYKDNNRPYHVRDTLVYPPAHDIVKPLREGTGEIVEWWKDPSQVCDEGRVLDEDMDVERDNLDIEEAGSTSDEGFEILTSEGVNIDEENVSENKDTTKKTQ